MNKIYRCAVCGNIVELLNDSGVGIVCCGQEMQVLTEKEKDIGMEKHLPLIEKKEGTILVKVGSIEHPMEDNHYIQWIELSVDGMFYRKFLIPGDKPEAEFCAKGDQVEARAYCNVHGLWKSGV